VNIVRGFECRVTATGAVTIPGWNFPVPAINVGTGNDLVVGYSTPVPAAHT